MKVLKIAFYLPQFHPIPENDVWWGNGFTEWFNVVKAKKLFPGHYQPKIPTDLGFYDLRLSETREMQARLAKRYGLDAFCYWHYWFGNGKKLLDRPFKEVLQSKSPDFPFCLAWANHSWEKKTWIPSKENLLLQEQCYFGLKDFEEHFNYLLPAFLDSRYLKFNSKPVFVIWDPVHIPDLKGFISFWNELARKNGLPGINFIGYLKNLKSYKELLDSGFDDIIYDNLENFFSQINFFQKVYFFVLRELFKIPKHLNYKKYISHTLKFNFSNTSIYPVIYPNFDHSPRSGEKGFLLYNSKPYLFKNLLTQIKTKLLSTNRSKNFLFIKSWNEWGEGNYLEPDLRFGNGFLESLKD